MTHHIFITGASRGIGLGLLEHFLQKEKCKVYGLARSEAALSHERYIHHSCDLSQLDVLPDQAISILPEVAAGDAVSLINNAGLLGEIGHMGRTDVSSLREVMDVNVSAAAIMMDAFIRRYARHQGKKVILNISSGAGKRPVDGWAAYCASKAALDMLSEVVATECAMDDNDIWVFAVAPGVVDTQMQSKIRSADAADFSNVQGFIDLKENDQLSTAAQVAAKLEEVIEHPEEFTSVLLDVRDI